jgi:hypothetical protein
MNLDPSSDAANGGTQEPGAGNVDPHLQREQLLKKLHCLIAVLEAAISKVRRNQHVGSGDPDRLERIRANLEKTLAICQRAKVTLERRGTLPSNLPPEVSEAVGASGPAPGGSRRRTDADASKMTYRDYVELSSFEEFKKFRSLAPISLTEIASCDLDQLVARFGKP